MAQYYSYFQYIAELIQAAKKLSKYPGYYAIEAAKRVCPKDSATTRTRGDFYRALSQAHGITIKDALRVAADNELHHLATKDFIHYCNKSGIEAVKARKEDKKWAQLYIKWPADDTMAQYELTRLKKRRELYVILSLEAAAMAANEEDEQELADKEAEVTSWWNENRGYGRWDY